MFIKFESLRRLNCCYHHHHHHNDRVHKIFLHITKACDSVRREVLYNSLIEFVVNMKEVNPIKICLTETYSKVRTRKNLSDNFRIQNDLKQGDALTPLLFNVVL
jgi:hypothetical protein